MCVCVCVCVCVYQYANVSAMITLGKQSMETCHINIYGPFNVCSEPPTVSKVCHAVFKSTLQI